MRAPHRREQGSRGIQANQTRAPTGAHEKGLPFNHQQRLLLPRRGPDSHRDLGSSNVPYCWTTAPQRRDFSPPGSAHSHKNHRSIATHAYLGLRLVTGPAVEPR
jgi:hypothetical protein